MNKIPVLAGDIGGTKSNLALFCGTPEAPECIVERTYQNREFASLDAVVQRFFAEARQTADIACFGVAGTVLAGNSYLPNLGWQLSETALAQALGLHSVHLMNDLKANALGLTALTPDQLFTLNQGQARPGGNRALIAAGTGLGMAMMTPDFDGWRVLPSEGGHADFAPRGRTQVALLRYLAERHDHVSVERVVSGAGLVNIYDFLKDSGQPVPDGLAQRLAVADDLAAVVAQAGMRHEAAICVMALDLFLSVYGAVAGNLALTALATGGVYIGGGIAPKLLSRFEQGGFMTAFADKGRFGTLLAEMPVQIILEPKTALLGAAQAALQQATVHARVADDRRYAVHRGGKHSSVAARA